MDLAQQLSVSRGVVRELLRRLDDRGVVSISPGRGARVQPVGAWNVLDAEVLKALMPTPASISVLADYLECRKILETEAASLAAERAAGDDLTVMADAFARMSACAEDRDGESANENERHFHEADIAFHAAIFHASGNRVLPHIVEPIQRVMGALLHQLARPENWAANTLPEHKAILSAIADHDSMQAREAMQRHLTTIEGYLHEYRLQMADSVTSAQRVTSPQS